MGDPNRFRDAVKDAGIRLQQKHGHIEEIPPVSLVLCALNELEMGMKYGNLYQFASNAYFFLDLARAKMIAEEKP